MSTLRTNTLQDLAETVSIDVVDLAGLSGLSGPDGATLVGYNAGTVDAELDSINVQLGSKVSKTSDTGAAGLPSGNTAARPAVPAVGMFRHNSETNEFEGYSAGAWGPVSGGSSTTSAVEVMPPTFIDPASLTKIGNMTLGTGLAGLFDTTLLDGARREATTGYAGLTLAAPTPISFVEVVSGTNGFDGSGLANNATLQLYGKNGAAPVSGTDGTLLGTVVVVDSNTQKVGTIITTDHTPYTHVWVSISTAVWATAVEMRFFKKVPFPTAESAGTKVKLSSCDNNVALTTGGREIPQFRIPLRLTSPRTLLIDFHGDVVHTGLSGTGAIAVGYSFTIMVRSGATEEEMRNAPFYSIPNAIGGGNVSEISPQHYGNRTITTARTLGTGYHEISVLGSGHTDGSAVPGILQVLSEAGQGLNGMRVVVLP